MEKQKNPYFVIDIIKELSKKEKNKATMVRNWKFKR